MQRCIMAQSANNGKEAKTASRPHIGKRFLFVLTTEVIIASRGTVDVDKKTAVAVPRLLAQYFGERAKFVPMRPCRTIFPPVIDEEIGRFEPVLFWDDRHKIPLDLLRRLLARKPEHARQALYMGIHGDSLHHAVGIPENHIRRLTPDARDCNHCFYRFRQISFKLFLDHLSGGKKIFCFLTEKFTLMD